MSMVEVERKRQIEDPAALLQRIAHLGYMSAGTVTETDTYYSRPDVDFMQTVECLRVRQRDGFAEVTYKPASTLATSSEAGVVAKVETNVLLAGEGQAEEANRLLFMLGMVELARVEKRRTMWHPEGSDHVTVAVDEITGVGSFLEVEVMSRSTTLANGILTAVEGELGVAELPVVRLPYRDLVMRREMGVR